MHVHEKIRQYITEIVQATREHQDLALGGSPRASIALFRTAQAVAAVRGRNFVEPDDVKQVVSPVLVHRLILKLESRLQNVSVDEILTDIMDKTPVPLLEARGATGQAKG